MDTLAAREFWPRAKIEEFQLDRLNAMWQHAIRHVPYYRQLLQKHNLPERFGNLEEYSAVVPILDKHTVKQNPLLFLSENLQPGKWRYTGGSTGTPMAVYWQHDAYAEILRCQYRFRYIWGVDIFDRVIFLWGHSASFAPGISGWIAKTRLPIEDFLRNRIRFSAYHLSQSNLQKYLERMKSFKPVMLYGYSAAVYLLALEALDKRFQINSLKAIMLTSEPVLPNFINTIQSAFGAPAVSEYGCVELGFIAYEDINRIIRVREDIILAETIVLQNGYYGIILSSLNNSSFPLLRYDIGDMTDRPLDKASIGFADLGSIIGRNNDFLYSKSGNPVYPEGITHVFEHHISIKRFTAHQAADGKVTVLLEVVEGNEQIDVRSLEHKLSSLLEGQLVEIKVTDAIPPTVGGKHRWIVSELAQIQR